MKHSKYDLVQMQSLPVEAKIQMTKKRIDEFVERFTPDGVYVSFSGGKDSTVLVDIVRNVCGYKYIPLVFVDVPTQYPELKKFVQTFDNVEILKPKTSFAEVCEKYGFPMFSKEISECIADARKYIKILTARQTDDTLCLQNGGYAWHRPQKRQREQIVQGIKAGEYP